MILSVFDTMTVSFQRSFFFIFHDSFPGHTADRGFLFLPLPFGRKIDTHEF
jgi:hypothetical protein